MHLAAPWLEFVIAVPAPLRRCPLRTELNSGIDGRRAASSEIRSLAPPMAAIPTRACSGIPRPHRACWPKAPWRLVVNS